MKNVITKNFGAKDFATKNLKYLLLTLSIFTSSSILSMIAPEQIQENDWHFNTTTISNTKEAKKQLITQDGFIEIEIPIIQQNNPAITEEQFKQEAAERYDAFLAELNTAINNPQATTEEKAQAQQMLTQIKGENAITKIKGLFLKRENARATIIFTPGFYPGNKENFAPFVKIAPTDCNLLFLELSGHGENGGTMKWLWNANKFGLTEHLEVIEAIKYVNRATPETPIVLFGWCSGAFTAARALIELRGDSAAGSDQDKIKQLNIKGLIFDSGFGSIVDVLPNVTDYVIKEKLKFLAPSNTDTSGPNTSGPNTFGPNAQANQLAGANNSNSLCGCGLPSILAPITTFLQPAVSFVSGLFNPIKPIINWTLNQFKSGTTGTIKLFLDTTISSIIKPAIVTKDGETNIYDKISKIADIPTFFIHSKGDLFTPIANAEKLYDTIKTTNPANDNFWKTEGYCHATNQIKHKHDYQSNLNKWLADIFGAQVPAPANTQAPSAKNTEAAINNSEQADKKLHKDIQDMIEIIDNAIKLIETQKQILQSQKPEAEKLKEKQAIDQELNKLLQAFFELLNKTSAIPEKSKIEIAGKLEELNKATTLDGQITALKAIKDVLLNINPENIPEQQNASDAATPGAAQDGQDNTEINDQKDKSKNKYSHDYNSGPNNNNLTNPQQQQNANNNTGANANNNLPSNSSSNNYPSSGGSSGSGYRNPGNGSSGSSGSGRSHSPSSGYDSGSGFGGSDWPSGSSYSNNQNEKDEEKPNLTQSEYECLLDEDYEQDSQMTDRPDRHNWLQRMR